MKEKIEYESKKKKKRQKFRRRKMESEIEPIIALPLPFKLDEKIFHCCDDEDSTICEPYSYNDLIKFYESMSGINEELCGKIENESME